VRRERRNPAAAAAHPRARRNVGSDFPRGASTHPDSTDRETPDTYIAAIAAAQRSRLEIEAALRERIAAIRAAGARDALRESRAIADNLDKLRRWCEARREPGVFSLKFPAGTVSWRTHPSGTCEMFVVRPVETDREEFVWRIGSAERAGRRTQT
jgi:phage host-nuclease inhibitor protein Gam